MRTLVIFFFAAAQATSLIAVPPGEEGNTSPMLRQAELDRLTAPYVAKARATYPVAKKRFLAGLPPGYKFLVTLPFSQPDKHTGKATLGEYMLVNVERIEKGRIYGRLGNAPVLIRNLKFDDHVSGRESDITNWIIEHPDRTEEGNFVGKFLEKHFERK